MAPRLHIVDRPGPGALVVLIHGSMDRSVSFFKIADLLPQLHVVMYDRRGYAKSLDVQPPASGLDDHVADLFEVVDERPAVLVGHSYGGAIALAAATRRPDLIRAVGAFETPMAWMPWWPKRSAGGGVADAAVRAADPGDAAEGFLRRMVGDARWESLPDKTRQLRRAEGAALVTEMTTIRQPPPPFELDDLSSFPLVLGHGSASLPHHQEAVRYQAAHVPSAELFVIEGGRHGSHASHPDEFAAFVRQVVEAADRR
jgi:pimeloyl-ACP methyl ester carboxylesterase